MVVLTVSQLNRYISYKFKEDSKLRGIILRGEISNFTAHRSGHFYFTLKDDEASVKAVMFRSNAQKVKFIPQDGMSVIVMGSISVFERDGVYQIYVIDIQPDGAGAASVALEQLKEKLRKLGVFDESQKRKLPAFPQKIGIVTALGGAALQDVINILSRRYPVGELCIFPAAVQGEEAPDSICRGIIQAGKSGCDVLIVGRGGGSAEDLSAFNTEKVAMCIYNSSIPVISAVGHETDITVSDLAADMRAPTPSAAAELAAPSVSYLKENIDFLLKRIRSTASNSISECENRYGRILRKLLAFSPENKLEKGEKELISLVKRLDIAFNRHLNEKEKKFMALAAEMEALSPLKVMQRGYSLVYRDEKILIDTKDLKVGDDVRIKLADGEFKACVTEKIS